METGKIILYVTVFIGVLALLEMFFSYFKAGKAVDRERKKWQSIDDIKQKEIETVTAALTFANHQLAILKQERETLKIMNQKLETEGKALGENIMRYANEINRLQEESETYRNLYEKEASRSRSAGGLGGEQRQPVDESLMLPNFFAFDHKPTKTEVKERYKRLCNIYHPDKGGDNETFQSISDQFQRTLKTAA